MILHHFKVRYQVSFANNKHIPKAHCLRNIGRSSVLERIEKYIRNFLFL